MGEIIKNINSTKAVISFIPNNIACKYVGMNKEWHKPCGKASESSEDHT